MNVRGKLTLDLPKRQLTKVQLRVLNFNPETLYRRVELDFYSRRQKTSLEKLFPSPMYHKCACGCGKALKGRQRRWATSDCNKFAVAVYDIITNNTPTIKRYLSLYTDWKCCKCGCNEDWREFKNGLAVSTLEIDHILAVQNGGGGCWLGNYQVICHTCHKQKTQVDKQIRNKPTPLQPSTLFW